jgi:hypothetical protein
MKSPSTSIEQYSIMLSPALSLSTSYEIVATAAQTSTTTHKHQIPGGTQFTTGKIAGTSICTIAGFDTLLTAMAATLYAKNNWKLGVELKTVESITENVGKVESPELVKSTTRESIVPEISMRV